MFSIVNIRNFFLILQQLTQKIIAMVKLSKELEKEIKDGTADIRDISKYLIDNYPVKVIADELAELLLLQPTEQIIVSQEQFNSLISLFRVRGFKGVDVAEEKVERRGRPRKRNDAI